MGVVGIGPPYVAPGGRVRVATALSLNARGSIYSECELHVNVTLVKTLQPLKALIPILLTEAGMVIDVRPEPAIALGPILLSCDHVTNDTEVREMQPLKALLPILLTEAGIAIDVIPDC